jgi:hypothetical protein
MSGLMSAFGTKRTSELTPPMSAFGGKADIGWDSQRCPLMTQSGSGTGDRLLVVSDAAALIADARFKGLLESRLTRFREIIVHRGHSSFRRALNCVEGSLAYRVVPKFKGAHVNPYHAGTWKRCEFAVGCIEAGNVKIAIVKLLVIRITECAQRRSLVALERGDGAVEHRSRFISRPELFGTRHASGQYQRQRRKYRHEQCISHGTLA